MRYYYRRQKNNFVVFSFIVRVSSGVCDFAPEVFNRTIMNNNLTITSRILVAFASGALIAVFFLPAWRIDLFAPQYPEGLTMNIWINGLTGDVEIINGLNHYIGMKHITEDMFPEFKFLPFVVGFFILLGMAVAITGNRKFLFIYIILTLIGGALAMYDFYNWAYDYGHHLDPTAPIQVPGLTYQPPLFGHKRLLNFDAYSFPHVGGWVVIAAGTLATGVWLVEFLRHRKVIKTRPAALIAITSLMLTLPSCNTAAEPFETGKDNCHFCKMAITDTRFGGEIITTKGKIFKFDDLHCIIQFLQSGELAKKDISQSLTINFDKPNTFLDTDKASFVISPELKSPMGSHAAAFADKAASAKFSQGKEAEVLDWNALYEKLK